jgi:hypothetical protein
MEEGKERRREKQRETERERETEILNPIRQLLVTTHK